MFLRIRPVVSLMFLGALLGSGCASRKKAVKPVVLKFVAGQDLGVVIHPVDWSRPADQDNPGADCTLKLETQGPPENVYSCVVKQAKNVYIVKLHETYKSDLDDRKLTKITVDSKLAVTRDMWVEELRKAGFREAPNNPGGARGSKWEFISPDESSQVTLFWNAASKAVSVRVLPRISR